MKNKEETQEFDMKQVGLKIKEVRSDAGESMEEFGKRLGISASAVYKWESGMTSIRENNLKVICDTYNVSEDWIKGKDMPKVPETDDHVKTRMLLNHAMMFLTEKDLLKAELFISDILEQPLHIGIMKPNGTEALA